MRRISAGGLQFSLFICLCFVALFASPLFEKSVVVPGGAVEATNQIDIQTNTHFRAKPMLRSFIGSAHAQTVAQNQRSQIVGEDTTSFLSPSLQRFYKKLEQLKGRTENSPVRILHIGGNSLFSDQFANTMRSAFSKHFPDAGRGNLLLDFTAKRSGAKKITYSGEGKISMASNAKGDGGYYGLSGVRFQLNEKGSHLVIKEKDGNFDWVEISFLSGPQYGDVKIQAGGLSQIMSLTDKKIGLKYLRIDGAGNEVRFLAARGHIEILSVRAGKNIPGILYETVAYSKDAFGSLMRSTTKFLQKDFQKIHPDLILLSLSEDFNDQRDFNPSRFEKKYLALIKAIKTMAPKAELILFGPFDQVIYPDELAHISGVSDANRHKAPCQGLSSLEQKYYKMMRMDKDKRLARLHPSLKHYKLRKAIYKIAKSTKISFFDWAKAMGGACSIQKWSYLKPALARQDLKQLTTQGERQSAILFYRWLMSAGQY